MHRTDDGHQNRPKHVAVNIKSILFSCISLDIERNSVTTLTLVILHLNYVISSAGLVPMNSLHVPKYDVSEMNSIRFFRRTNRHRHKCL